MNGAHIHLLLNHIPILGTVFGLLLLLWATLRKSDQLQRVSLGVFVLTALVAVPAYLSGEPAEEVVEHLPGVTHAIIEAHEKAALLALVAMAATGILSLASLILHRRAEKLPGYIAPVLLMLAVLTGGLMGWTGNLGGQIRHTEIRSGAGQTESGSHDEQKEKKSGEKENHDR